MKQVIVFISSVYQIWGQRYLQILFLYCFIFKNTPDKCHFLFHYIMISQYCLLSTSTSLPDISEWILPPFIIRINIFPYPCPLAPTFPSIWSITSHTLFVNNVIIWRIVPVPLKTEECLNPFRWEPRVLLRNLWILLKLKQITCDSLRICDSLIRTLPTVVNLACWNYTVKSWSGYMAGARTCSKCIMAYPCPSCDNDAAITSPATVRFKFVYCVPIPEPTLFLFWRCATSSGKIQLSWKPLLCWGIKWHTDIHTRRWDVGVSCWPEQINKWLIHDAQHWELWLGRHQSENGGSSLFLGLTILPTPAYNMNEPQAHVFAWNQAELMCHEMVLYLIKQKIYVRHSEHHPW